MGKTCFFCNRKPKYWVKDFQTKYLLCEIFDEIHVDSLRQYNLLELFKKKLKRDINLGIGLIIIGNFVLFSYYWGIYFSNVIPWLVIISGIYAITNSNKALKRIKRTESIQPSTSLGITPNMPSIAQQQSGGFCPNCGLSYSNADNFCVNCGFRFEES